MLIILSLLAAVGGVTGAFSLTKVLQEVLCSGETKKGKGRGNPAGEVDGAAHCRCLPESLSGHKHLIDGLLDDAEIHLRSLRRQKPGPSRSFKLVKLVESYHPELQSHSSKELLPVLSYVAGMVLDKAADLLAEDQHTALLAEDQHIAYNAFHLDLYDDDNLAATQGLKIPGSTSALPSA